MYVGTNQRIRNDSDLHHLGTMGDLAITVRSLAQKRISTEKFVLFCQSPVGGKPIPSEFSNSSFRYVDCPIASYVLLIPDKFGIYRGASRHRSFARPAK